MRLTLSLLAAILVSAQTAYAFPLPVQGESAALRALPVAESAFAADFRGIIALSNCSASLVRLADSRPSDAALVLTNGHCFEGGFIEPGRVVQNRASSRSMTLFLESSPNGRTARLKATKVLYATMTGTDITLYRLSETYAQIKSQYGVDALILSERKPSVGDAIEVVSGYWRDSYACSIEAIASTVREDAWSFKDSIRYTSDCKTKGGTSGSPILNPVTREVIGINNSFNEDGEHCTMNNPCEVGADGTTSAYQRHGYGQQSYWIASCLTETVEIDLTKEGCLLPKGI